MCKQHQITIFLHYINYHKYSTMLEKFVKTTVCITVICGKMTRCKTNYTTYCQIIWA